MLIIIVLSYGRGPMSFGEDRPSAGKVPIEPRPKVQTQIRRVVEAFREIEDGYKGADRAFRELKTLKDLARERRVERVELVRQFAYFAATPTHEGDGLFMLMLIDLLEIDDLPVVRALAPYLAADDRELWGFVHDAIPRIDKAYPAQRMQPLEPVNYEVYKDYIAGLRSRDEPVPEAFAEYIYRRLPGHALLAFFYAHDDAHDIRKGPEPKARPERSDILWAEHVVSDALWKKQHGFDEAFRRARPDAVEQLQKLSKREEWWVRLYVAEILNRQPEFQTAELVERLERDAHELVRQTISRKPDVPRKGQPPRKRDGNRKDRAPKEPAKRG